MGADRKGTPHVVEGQVVHFIEREVFRRRFEASFDDPAFDGLRDAIARLETVAWDGYREGRKSPRTAKAGPGFADPDYDLSVEWRANRDRLIELDAEQKLPSTPSRVLVVCGSPRNDGWCPGEMSKTFRLVQIVRAQLEADGMRADVLDLSRADDRVREAHPPVQGLRLDRDAAVPLAVQLLSEPRRAARPTTGWPRSTNA